MLTETAAAAAAVLFVEYADLRVDVAAGTLTPEAAEEIAVKRQKLEVGMDADFYNLAKFEGASRARTAGGNAFTKGKGHKLCKAKNHGKAMVGVRGAGYGNYACERLHRVVGGVASEGRNNHRQ